MTPALSRTDIFSADDIGTLFGNIVELRNIHKKFYAEVVKCGSVEDMARVIEQKLPPMSIAYNQYCSNFPRATSMFGEMQSTPTKTMRATNVLRRSVREDFDTARPNPLRSSMSLQRRKETSSTMSSGATNAREKRNSPTGIVRRHTIIGRPDRPEHGGFLKRTFSPRKSIKSYHEDVYKVANKQYAFLDTCLALSDLDDNLPLIAYLLEPVQRVMRYPLLLKGLKYYLQSSGGQNTEDLASTDRAIQIAEKLAIITNITQPYQVTKTTKTTSSSAPTSPASTSPVKSSTTANEKKRRSFEFMRQAAERLLRSR